MPLSNKLQIDLINLGIRELVESAIGEENVVLDDSMSAWEDQLMNLLCEKILLITDEIKLSKEEEEHLAEEIDFRFEKKEKDKKKK
jgi:hypothetical protein